MFASVRRLQATPAYTQLVAAMKGDLKLAMLAKQAVRKNTIRSALAAIKNAEIDGAAQSEHAVSRVLNKMIKQRIDSEKMYRDQQRADLAAVESEEGAILRHYITLLPVASADEVALKLEAWMRELAAGGPLKVGAVFRLITPELAAGWGTAPDAVKPLVADVYKRVFP